MTNNQIPIFKQQKVIQKTGAAQMH